MTWGYDEAGPSGNSPTLRSPFAEAGPTDAGRAGSGAGETDMHESMGERESMGEFERMLTPWSAPSGVTESHADSVTSYSYADGAATSESFGATEPYGGAAGQYGEAAGQYGEAVPSGEGPAASAAPFPLAHEPPEATAVRLRTLAVGEAPAVAPGPIWVPGAERVSGPRSGGTYLEAPWRFVFHTIEGEPSAAAFRRLVAGHTNPPHLWAMPSADLLLQTIPLDRSAYALARPGSIQTNRLRAVQVELWGFAAKMGAVPPEVIAWLAERLLAPVARLVPIDLTSVRPAGPGEPCYGVKSSCRMTAEQWQAFTGVCGHKDVPDNSHWDPGQLNLAAIAERARTLIGPTSYIRHELLADHDGPRFQSEAEEPDAFAAESFGPMEGETPVEKAKATIVAQTRRWGTDEAAVMAAMKALNPAEMAELGSDPAVISALQDELSRADLAAAASQLERGRVGGMQQADLTRVIESPARYRVGVLAAALGREVLLKHQAAVAATGTGTVQGNKCSTPAPAGATPSDCTEYVVDVLRRAFAARGRSAEWTMVLAAARKASGGALKGTELIKALQSPLGWEAMFWAPDADKPADMKPGDKKNEHSYAYHVARTSGTYYNVRLLRDRAVINYRRTDPRSTTDRNGIERLRRLPFGLLAARGGVHMALMINGSVYEVHQSAPATDPNAIEARPLELFGMPTSSWPGWLSGVIAAPPGDIALAWHTP